MYVTYFLPMPDPQTSRCDECNLTFRTEKSLARHRELHDPTRPLACARCPLRYKNKDQLVRHVQTHEKPDIECELCHRVFGRPDHLKRHIATKHSALSPTDQQHLSENLGKKKRQHISKTGGVQSLPKPSPSTPPPTTVAAALTSHHQIPETNLSNVILPKSGLETTPDRPGSELSTISVAELNTVTVHPNQAFQTASPNSLPSLLTTTSSSQLQSPIAASVQPQYRPQPHIDYSQMFQFSLTQTTISTNPDEL